MSHIDVAGREIKAGDYILYAAALGRCPVLRYARVEDLYSIENPLAYRRSREALIYKLKVRSVTQYSYATDWKLLNKGNLITLAFCDRTVIVPTDQVPPAVVAMLQGT